MPITIDLEEAFAPYRFDADAITVRDIRAAFGCSDNKAREILAREVDAGRLEADTSARQHVWRRRTQDAAQAKSSNRSLFAVIGLASTSSGHVDRAGALLNRNRVVTPAVIQGLRAGLEDLERAIDIAEEIAGRD